ncbi:hypothetical protein K9L67_04860 [Candidatus Woesearchaeota archaeon]|nr:hypothetical protein [Candidatus Woesearchaeota archaeon]MCF7901530.1 hypothetical protein [Candidatus Woesearchaeota archaeon]MCF8013874.1 hypothetical protein [Candidatus Woesearchaeota archaeon]
MVGTGNYPSASIKKIDGNKAVIKLMDSKYFENGELIVVPTSFLLNWLIKHGGFPCYRDSDKEFIEARIE